MVGSWRAAPGMAAAILACLPVHSSAAPRRPAALPAARNAMPRVPPIECHARVGFDRNMTLPGYVLPTAAGAATCIPFLTAAHHPPAGYRGDFYVDEFTDAKLRERWLSCKRDPQCRKRVYDQVLKRHPPNREFGMTDPHKRYLLGKIDERGGETDLSTIRRPGFFARSPYREPIAGADPQTYVVEFTAPPEPYERIQKHMTADIKLRGWYIRGDGVVDGKGARRRALVIMSGGGGDRVTAIDDPSDTPYSIDSKTGDARLNDFPNATTGVKGEADWRRAWYALHQAGFDVLAFDRRGVGISGGYSDTNTLQQGRDLLDIIASLRSGKGMRALDPAGIATAGRAAAEAVRGGATARGLPVFLLGSSRGTMASGWAMTINFDRECSYDLPVIRCHAPRRDPSIKGAMLVADFSSGVGHIEAQTTPEEDLRGLGRDRGLFIGGIELENNIVFFPSSAILAGIHTWPSAFFARGLWDYADALEGEMDSYRRVNGLKDLVVVRGPHTFETWPAPERTRVTVRMIAYARAVLFGHKTIPGRRQWSDMKELVATSDDIWEPSTTPTVLPSPSPTP